jgi:peptidoglycan hydrolase-like protein with peptidoglycan-binding domain
MAPDAVITPDGNAFRQGDRDAGPNGTIRSAQTNMIRLGLDGVGEVDGVYGRNTMNGVQDAQGMFGLPRTGVLDQATQDRLGNLTDDQIAFFTSETEAMAEEETPVAEQVTSGFVSSFVDQMAEAEGTEDHQAVEGQFTYAYGILPATARSYGIDPESYPNRREFAEAVYGKMNEQARTDYSEVFNGLSDSDSLSVLSTYINLGRLPSGVVDALSGETKDFQAAGRSLTNVIHFTNRQTGQKYSSKGVSARRASEYNTLMSGQEGFSPVTQVQVTGTRAKPTFNWLDASNNVVETFTSSRNLDPKNSLTTVSVN